MHFNSLLTSAIALTLWAPQAAAQAESCTSSQKASPVTVRVLESCPSQEAKASPVASVATDITQDEAIRTLRALGYASESPEGANERGYLGIVMDVEDGAMVLRRVMEGSPAAKAGLKAGDRITRLGDHKVKNQESLTGFLQGLKAGGEVELRIVRDGWVKEMAVELAPLSSIQVDESPLGEEIAEEPIIQDFEIVEVAPVDPSHGEWVQAGESDAKLWITHLNEDDGKGKAHKIELKGLAGLAELGDVTGLVELSELGIDLKGLEGLKGLEVLQGLEGLEGFEGLEGLQGIVHLGLEGGDVEGLKERIHGHLMKELGSGAHGEHEIEIHVEHDGGSLDIDDLKQRIKKRVKKQLAPHAEHSAPHAEHSAPHAEHSAPHAEHDIQVLVEHLGDLGDGQAKVRGKMIMIDEDGNKHEIDLGGDGAHVLEWTSKAGKTNLFGNTVIDRLHEDGEHEVRVHTGGNVFLGKPGGKIEGKDPTSAPSTGFFFSDDDDDDDDDDESSDRSNKRRVIRRRAPATGAFVFDARSGSDDSNHAREEVEIHFGDDAKDGTRTITVVGAPDARRSTLLGGGHDETIGKLREELVKLRMEIARLREEVRKMHR